MDYLDEQQYEKRSRAGLIPYMYDDAGELISLMMVSSNAKFGGPRPMLSKGKIEDGEDELQCAIREAEEELGLVPMNMIGEPELLIEERVVLRSGTYDLTVYTVAIRDRWDFGKWCDETEYTIWMTQAQFEKDGRRDHIKYVNMVQEKLREKT
jgi:8-oxo-dGTP pyrophosphatase MutT (NUDIX family)